MYFKSRKHNISKNCHLDNVMRVTSLCPFSQLAPETSSCTFLLLTDGKFYFLICLSTHFNEVLHVFHYTVSSCTFQINSSECRLFTIETYGE